MSASKGNFRNGPSSFSLYLRPDKSPRASPAVDDGRRQKRRHTTPSLTWKLSVGLVDTYRRVNPTFVWLPIQNPRRVLTKDPRPGGNNGFDNKTCDLILTVGDVLTAKGNKFRVLDMLGQGTFGQVVKCRAEWSRGEDAASDTDRMEDEDAMAMPRMVAVKVVKNKPAYFNQAKVEIKVLKKVGEDLGPGTDPRQPGSTVIRLLHDFEYHHHLCLVFELMSVNLYELIKHQEFRGLPLATVRAFSAQLLDALAALYVLGVVHCDLKPENVLLENFGDPAHPRIKLIDLGSACYQDHTVYTYIQSRFYRAPEVILGMKYGSPIDLWSLGCCVVELFMGLPVFPGVSAHNQLARVVEMLGMPPLHMLKEAKKAKMFFVETDPSSKQSPTAAGGTGAAVLADAMVDLREDYFSTSRDVVGMSGEDDDLAMGAHGWRIKSAQEWALENGLREGPEKTKRYVKEKTLFGIVARCEAKRRPKNEPVEKLRKQDVDSLVDFCAGLLRIDPAVRWTAAQALLHPFIQDRAFTEPFVPRLEPEHALSEESGSTETNRTAKMDDMSEEDEEEALDVDQRVTRTSAMPLTIKQKPHAAAPASASSAAAAAAVAAAAAATAAAGRQKRKISDVASPMGSLSSALGSPITRPEAPYPIAHAARWSDLGLLGSPAFNHKSSVGLGSPNWALPSGGESPYARVPVKADAYRTGVSLPNASMLGGDEVRHTSFRKIDFEAQANKPSWVLAKPGLAPVPQQGLLHMDTAGASSLGAGGDYAPHVEPHSKSPSSFGVEKSLAKWAPFEGGQLLAPGDGEQMAQDPARRAAAAAAAAAAAGDVETGDRGRGKKGGAGGAG
jgi:serine/threonine protein kinase